VAQPNYSPSGRRWLWPQLNLPSLVNAVVLLAGPDGITVDAPTPD
jgi:hypothetical protein